MNKNKKKFKGRGGRREKTGDYQPRRGRHDIGYRPVNEPRSAEAEDNFNKNCKANVKRY